MAAAVLQIKNYLLRNAVTLGNTDREERHLCSDLLNQYVKTDADLDLVAEGTFLCTQTLRRMITMKESENGQPYNPSSDTCARILRYFGMEASYKNVVIKDKYKNKPKRD